MTSFSFEKKFPTTVRKGFKSFIDHHLINIPTIYYDFFPVYDSKRVDYELVLGEKLQEDVSNIIIDALKDSINSDMVIQFRRRKKGESFQYDFVFNNCLIKAFKKIFISSIAYSNADYVLDSDNQESIVFFIDVDSRTVTIEEVKRFIPQNNPFYDYLKLNTNSVKYSLLVSSENNDGVIEDKELKDFYDYDNCSRWFTRNELKLAPTKPGIYMLYHCDRNEIYIGKAINIRYRLENHQREPKDYIKDYTHFRYTLINEEYLPFLFLIENASIHDLACLLNMPKGKNLIYPLVRMFSKIDLKECAIKNKVEHQTKIQKTK